MPIRYLKVVDTATHKEHLIDTGGVPVTDATPTQGSTNPVSSGGVYTALAGKQDALTFDSTPTANSNNPVTSDGIRTAINNAISGVLHEIRVVTSLPTTGESGVMYLINETEPEQSRDGDGWVEMVQGDASEIPSSRTAAVTTETVENGTLYTLSLTGYENLRYSVKWQGSLFGTWVDIRYNTMTHLRSGSDSYSEIRAVITVIAPNNKNVYSEYIWQNGAYELIGNTAVSITSQYVTQEISATTMVEVSGVGYQCVQSVTGVTANTGFTVYGLDMTKLGAKLTVSTGTDQVIFTSAAAPLASQTITIELRG